MKKVKIAFWVLVTAFVGVVIFQNRGFFLAESRLILDLGIAHYETPLLANAIFFVSFFIAGLLIAYFSGLLRHFKDSKAIKTLKAKESSLVQTVAALEKELAERSAAGDDGQTADAAAPMAIAPDDETTPVSAEVK